MRKPLIILRFFEKEKNMRAPTQGSSISQCSPPSHPGSYEPSNQWISSPSALSSLPT